jgi:hypothetical protein
MSNHLLAAGLFCLLAMACTKHQELAPTTTQKSAQADLVYYYKETAYPLYLSEEEGEVQVIEDATYQALQAATNDRPLVTFTFSDQPSNHYYLFDSEFEGYDYMEQNDANPFIGRKFKVSLRIDELRTALTTQFGAPLDFKNTAVVNAAQQGIAAIYEELHINAPFPNDVEAFLGMVTDGFKRPKTLTSIPVLSVWEHSNTGGSVLHVEQGNNTVIWNYGAFDCFTMAANPDLTLEYKPVGSNWNDCISSKCLSYIQGADAIAEGYYKDSHYGVYGCGFAVQITRKNNLNAYPGPCFDMRDQNWVRGFFCGHMNDQISSIRIKAIWENCYNGDDTVFDDLYNQ